MLGKMRAKKDDGRQRQRKSRTHRSEMRFRVRVRKRVTVRVKVRVRGTVRRRKTYAILLFDKRKL